MAPLVSPGLLLSFFDGCDSRSVSPRLATAGLFRKDNLGHLQSLGAVISPANQSGESEQRGDVIRHGDRSLTLAAPIHGLGCAGEPALPL